MTARKCSLCLIEKNQIESLEQVFAPAAAAAEERKRKAEEEARRKAEEAAGKDDNDPASLWKRPWDENGGDDPDKKDK
mgnify:CR=1 FL=1